MARDNCERKAIIVTMKPVTILVPEEWTDEEITRHLDESNEGIWEEWKYEEPWR